MKLSEVMQGKQNLQYVERGSRGSHNNKGKKSLAINDQTANGVKGQMPLTHLKHLTFDPICVGYQGHLTFDLIFCLIIDMRVTQQK